MGLLLKNMTTSNVHTRVTGAAPAKQPSAKKTLCDHFSGTVTRKPVRERASRPYLPTAVWGRVPLIGWNLQAENLPNIAANLIITTMNGKRY